MSGLWTSALNSAGSHLSAGWFWLFPLLFAIHDAEEASYVWKEGSLHNSISYTTLNVAPDTRGYLIRVDHLYGGRGLGDGAGCVTSGDLHIRGAVGRIYGPRFCPSLSRVARPQVHSWCRNSAAARCIRRLVHLRQTHRNGDPELDVGRSQFCSRHSCHVAFDLGRSEGRLDLRLRSAVPRRSGGCTRCRLLSHAMRPRCRPTPCDEGLIRWCFSSKPDEGAPRRHKV